MRCVSRDADYVIGNGRDLKGTGFSAEHLQQVHRLTPVNCPSSSKDDESPRKYKILHYQ